MENQIISQISDFLAFLETQSKIHQFAHANTLIRTDSLRVIVGTL